MPPQNPSPNRTKNQLPTPSFWIASVMTIISLVFGYMVSRWVEISHETVWLVLVIAASIASVAVSVLSVTRNVKNVTCIMTACLWIFLLLLQLFWASAAVLLGDINITF